MRWQDYLLPGAILFAGISCSAPAEKYEGDCKELVELTACFLNHYCEGRFEEVERLFAPHAVVAIDRVDKDEQSLLTAGEFLAGSRAAWNKGTRFTESLAGQPVVLRDHNVVCVWAPYLVEADSGDAEGIDVFQWIKMEGEWRLVSLSYTNRSVPCPAREQK
jgi:hypothetical protein